MHDTTTPSDDVVYAGFWRRWGALLIDSLLLSVGMYAVIIAIALALWFSGIAADWSAEHVPMWAVPAYFGLILVFYAAAALYYSLQESSVHQATLGKRALGIKVTDAQGRRLTRGQALGRWFAASLSYLTMYVGFLIAAFTPRKQALHDLVADTLVVDRWAYTDHPERQQRHVGALAILLALFMLAIPVLAILAAIAIPSYQQYLVRAKVAEAVALAQPLQATIAAYHDRTGDCPANGEGGIRPADAYAGASVAGIDTGAMEDSGHCAIQITLRGLPDPDADGKRIWLELDPASGRWGCSSELEDRLLPTACRG